MVGDAKVFCKVSVCGLDGESNRWPACCVPAGKSRCFYGLLDNSLFSHVKLTSLSNAVILFPVLIDS